MKDIPVEFISNRDSCGNHVFKQIKRKDNLFLYSRTRVSDKTIHSFEVFRAKFIKKGAKLPGGMVEAEDRYAYPGAGGFGKFAKSCKTLDQAEHWFEVLEKDAEAALLVAEESPDTDPEEGTVSEAPTEKKQRGRVAKVVNMKLPKKGEQFTMKHLMLLTGEGQPILYQRLKPFIEIGHVSIIGAVRKEGVRGRAETLYMSNTDDFSGQDTVVSV